MADQQIEELTALANVAPGDELIINDVSDTTDDAGGSPKKVTAQTLGIRQNVVTVATTTQVAVNGGYYLCKPATAAGNIVVTLPATPNVGDTVTIEVIEQDTTNQYTVGIDRNGQNVRGSAVVASWLLVANGERLTFRYIDGTYGWTVLDERIKHGARIHANAVQSLPDNAFTVLNFKAVDFTNAGLADTANNKIKIIRPGVYQISVTVSTLGIFDEKSLVGELWNDGGGKIHRFAQLKAQTASNASYIVTSSEPLELAADGYQVRVFHNNGAAMNTVYDVSAGEQRFDQFGIVEV